MKLDSGSVFAAPYCYIVYTIPCCFNFRRRWIDSRISDSTSLIATVAAHPGELRSIPELAASLGMREGELFGLAGEDLDLDGREPVAPPGRRRAGPA